MKRRQFLSISAGAAAALPFASLPGDSDGPRDQEAGQGYAVLFQGDSITDGGRARSSLDPNLPLALGAGYPFLVAASLLRSDPRAGWRFFNRGVSGDRVPELVARWETDTIALAPQILTILVGVNDYWHTKLGRYNGSADEYERGYVSLIERTLQKLPNTRIVILEPFVLPIGHVDSSWFPDFDERRAAARRVAERTRASFIPLQNAFNQAASSSGPANWTYDGVHPTPAGHGLIADAVMRELTHASGSG